MMREIRMIRVKPVQPSSGTDERLKNCSEILLTMMSQRDVQEEYLRLRGQMLYVHEWRAIIYLATPV